MSRAQTLVLTQKNIQQLVSLKKAIAAVEGAFVEYQRHQAQMPAKIYLNLKKYNGDFRAMPAYLEDSGGCAHFRQAD